MTYAIQVDFDVYKAIFSRRSDESVTENDVLRKLLGLPLSKLQSADPATAAPTRSASGGDWLAKNVRFPIGTEFRATYKGKTYGARVESGSLVMNGNAYDSPSAAAVAITGNAVNGWRFWECRLPGKSTWQRIESLR